MTTSTAWKSGVTATLIAENCQPVGYDTTGALVYNAVNENGFWDVYRDGESLTAAGPGLVWTHRGASDMRGSELLLTVATSQMPESAPGEGAGNDIVLLDLDAGTTRILVAGRMGVLWARWHPTLDRICWAQQVKSALASPPFGTQQIHVADVTSTGITNEITYASLPTGFYETYGWLSDGQTLVFASDAATGDWLKTTFYALPDSTPTIETLAAPLLPATGYHEFAFVAPDGMFNDARPSLLVGCCDGTLGLELWRLILGSGATERLTYFEPGFGLGVGGLCFDPSDPKRLAVGVKVTAAGAINGYRLEMP